jgi:hypothetical protein
VECHGEKQSAPGTTKVPFNGGDLNLPDAGPVPVMMAGELAMARVRGPAARRPAHPAGVTW